MSVRIVVVAALCGLGLGCRQAAPPSGQETSSTGTSTGTGPVGTTFTDPDACQSSEDCEEDAHCVAPYDPGSDPPMGPGACVQACIEANDLSRWCFDDAGCCGDLRCQEVDGFCEPLPGASSDDTGSSGTDSGSGSGSGSGTDSGTDSGSSSGGSSDGSGGSSGSSGTSTG